MFFVLSALSFFVYALLGYRFRVSLFVHCKLKTTFDRHHHDLIDAAPPE